MGECELVRVSARADEYECVYIAGAQGVLLYGDLAAPNVCVRSAGQVAGGGPCTRAGGLCVPSGLCLEAAAGADALRPTFNHWAWFSVSPSLVWRRHVQTLSHAHCARPFTKTGVPGPTVTGLPV